MIVWGKKRVLCSVQRENNGSKIFTFSFLCRNSRRLRASDLGGAHFPDFFFHARHFFIIVSRHGFCACVSTQTATLSPPSRVQLAFSKNSLQRQKLETHFLKKKIVQHLYIFFKKIHMTEKSIIILISVQNGGKTRVHPFPSHRHKKVARKGTFCLFLLYLL